MLRPWALRSACIVLTAAALLLPTTTTLAATTPGQTGLVAAARSAAAPAAGVAVRATSSGWAHTISGMAAHVCGRSDLALWRQIARDNGIADPDRIQLGQVITVRCTSTAAPARATSPTPQPQPRAATWVAPLSGTIACGGPGGRFGADRGTHSHAGIDLSRPSGTPIRAVHAGVVKLVAWQSGGAGHYIMISHGGGAYTVSMHMVRRSPLRVGQHVTAGQTIGYVGSTGHSSGPHLHFEVHKGPWNQINPAPWLRAHGIAVRGC